MNIFLLIVGMFIEGNASMIILVPLLHPIAQAYGINEIQFAMTYIFNNAIGALSPPMGNADVRHLRHNGLQNGRVYQGSGTVTTSCSCSST